uniref:Alpha amylase Alstotide S2 n=1 Tax=Alstonia scholaris TaxID=52822 RepID=A0A0S0ZR33_ALSSC|nr:alpha amylase precursor Alstotide S2 [Alstonia scholaris]
MAKLACFLLLLLLASVFEVDATVEAKEEVLELPSTRTSRKMLPKVGIINTIIQLPENTENLGCRPYGYRCDGVINQCCDPYRCTPPLIGICL